MNEFARVVPTVRVSGLSGCVRVKSNEPDSIKTRTGAGLRVSVRLVRVIFNSLTCARARGVRLYRQGADVSNGLGSLFLSGQAGQGKEAGVFV